MATVIVSDVDRAAIARRGHYLELFTIGWAVLEASIALVTAMKSHSVSLAGFGFDSLIEVVSGAALMWRMSHEMAPDRRHCAERTATRSPTSVETTGMINSRLGMSKDCPH